MRLQTVPAHHGTLWVRRGLRAFFTHPMAYAALFATFMFGVVAAALVPFIGPLVVVALLPLVSLGFMIATRIVVEGGFPTPRVYIDPLRADRPRRISMIWLGVLYAVATVALLWLSDVVDGGALEALMDTGSGSQPSPDVLAAKLSAPGLFAGMLVRFGLAGLLSVPFWHAPALVYWDGHGCAKALFSSTVAVWRNRSAFMVYSLIWFGLLLGCGVLASLVFSLLGQPELIAVAGVPMSLIFTTVFYASLYFTFADCFVAGDTGPPTAH